MENDLIRRKDALIAIGCEIVGITTEGRQLLDSCEFTINQIPSIESKIIRCKDCKHAHLTYRGECKYCDRWMDNDDNFITLYLDGDFYCGFAERKA